MPSYDKSSHADRTRRYLYGLVATNAAIVALIVAFFGYHQWVHDRVLEKVVQYHTVSARAAQSGLLEIHYISDGLWHINPSPAGSSAHRQLGNASIISGKSLTDHVLNLADERDTIAALQQRFADPEFDVLTDATIGAFDAVLQIGSAGEPGPGNLNAQMDLLDALALRLQQLARLHMAARDRLTNFESQYGLNNPTNLLTMVGVLTALGILVGARVVRGVTAVGAERDKAMRTLRESETRLIHFTDSLETAQRIARIGNWERDAGTDSEWWSDENYRIIGFEPGSVAPSRETFRNAIHIRDRERVGRITDEAETNGTGYQVEFRFVRSDGSEGYGREIAEPVVDSQGRITGQRGTFQDITEQREVEAGLARTLRRLNDSQAIARIGNWEWDIATGTEWWSEQQYRNYGLSPGPGPVEANLFVKYVHSDDREWAAQATHDAVAAAKPLDIEFRTVGADGIERVLWGYGEPEFDEAGRPVRMVGTTLDITERKKAEDAIREGKARLDAFFAEAPAGLALCDKDGRYVRINETLAATHGLPIESHLGKLPTEFLPEEFARLIEEGNRKVIEQRTPMMNVEIKAPLPGSKGGMIHCVHSRFPILDASGEVSGIGVVSVDVSELKKAQQELARLNAELEQRVDARTAELRAAQEELVRRERFATLGQLTATVSHELRNPLGAIRTSLYVIDRYASQLDERVARAVGRVNRSITRCDNIIDELLDFARIRDLRFERLELDAWLDAILDEQQLPEGIAVHKEFGIGDSVVPADADRLRRAVINVYENACQAMRAARADDGALTTSEDQLWITTRLSNERAEMVFEDSGPGIAPGSLSQIFEPLFSTKNFGVGLGLPTVRQIMEQHGGGVEACNVEGGGARFTLWLPLGQNRPAGAQRPT